MGSSLLPVVFAAVDYNPQSFNWDMLQFITMPTKNIFQLSLAPTHSSLFLYITHKTPIPFPHSTTSMLLNCIHSSTSSTTLNCNPHSFPNHITSVSLNFTIPFSSPSSGMMLNCSLNPSPVDHLFLNPSSLIPHYIHRRHQQYIRHAHMPHPTDVPI
jgi:hypothetical protein